MTDELQFLDIPFKKSVVQQKYTVDIRCTM